MVLGSLKGMSHFPERQYMDVRRGTECPNVSTLALLSLMHLALLVLPGFLSYL
jgi:hypothetical protein